MLQVAQHKRARWRVLGQLGEWFGNYNHNHLHSGLGMRSSREFIRAQQSAKVSG